MLKPLICLLLCCASFVSAHRPNIIYILADDLGYGDLSFLGQTKFETPHIDALARRGMVFTSHYSGSAVCAPSRCSLLTGRHTGNADVRGNDERPPEGQQPMLGGTFTAAQLLEQAGYVTGAFGKWGLGYPGSVSDPLHVGFHRFYGYNCQYMAHSYYPAWLWNDHEREFLWGNIGSFHKDYAPDFIHKEAINFIRENKANPFFLYYALIQPHADMVAPEAYMEKYRGKFLPESSYDGGYYIDQPEGHAAFAAMVNVLDDYVGDLVKELETLGIADDSLIIFTSDNGAHSTGGHDPEFFNSSAGSRGFKRDLYEGGIHVPMIAVWPLEIQAGSFSDHVCAFWDVLATLADVVDMSLENIEHDGVSFYPTLTGAEGQKQQDYFYWEFHEKRGRVAIRKGKWKGVRYDVSRDPDSPLELYDLEADPSESRNLNSQYPEIVKELDALIKQSHSPSPNPKWNFSKPAKRKKANKQK